MADRFDAGGDVATALQAQGRRLPEHFVGLLLAGIRTGRLAEMLEEFVDLERSRQELRRRLWMAFAYPLFLLVVLAGTAVVIHAQVEGFRRIFAEFGTELPDMTRFFFATVGPVTWLLVATAILAVVRAAGAPGDTQAGLAFGDVASDSHVGAGPAVEPSGCSSRG